MNAKLLAGVLAGVFLLVAAYLFGPDAAIALLKSLFGGAEGP